jgi:hypothetical protein
MAPATGPGNADELREHVLARMVPGRREDDIAVLVVQLSGEAHPSPAEP